MSRAPQNGGRTHPLTDAAFDSMGRLPRPAQEINPGVVNRLLREDLAEVFDDVSPYKTHKGGKIAFLRLTPAGVERLRTRTR